MLPHLVKSHRDIRDSIWCFEELAIGAKMCTACRFDCNHIQEEKGKAVHRGVQCLPTGSRWTYWQGQRGATKKGRCFFTPVTASRSGGRKRLGCVPRRAVPLLFISLCFFPHNSLSSWGGHSTKGTGTQSPPHKNKLASGQESATFHKLLHNTWVS